MIGGAEPQWSRRRQSALRSASEGGPRRFGLHRHTRTRLSGSKSREFGYADRRLGAYEEDHLVPLDLGGAPYDPRNLWPEPRVTPDGWNADLKDELEAVLSRQVCSGRVPLAEAQAAIAADWTAAYNRFVVGR
jgi:hypothetical protein